MIDAQTKYVAVFGNPVSHSLSPRMHNAAFSHLGLNIAYLAFGVEHAADAATAMRKLSFLGGSITVPHKGAIVPHLDDLDEISRSIGLSLTRSLRRSSTAVSWSRVSSKGKVASNSLKESPGLP